MAQKHHPKEARIRAVQQQDGGRSASDICKDMNITPSTLKRWRDQLHLLAPSDSVKMREQEKLIEHMARIVADQAVRMRIMEIALQKNAKPWGGQAGRQGGRRGALSRGGQGAGKGGDRAGRPGRPPVAGGLRAPRLPDAGRQPQRPPLPSALERVGGGGPQGRHRAVQLLSDPGPPEDPQPRAGHRPRRWPAPSAQDTP
jgi:transposase-like protein